MEQIKKLLVARENRTSLTHAARTTTAAVVSLLLARLLQLPEDYWAAITSLIVMQSTLGAALAISVQRFAGTAVGAAVGALAATYWRGNVVVFGVGVFAIGILCSIFRVQRSAYRYASIALAIVMLVMREQSAWVTAIHRFVEVSLGIGVALALTAAWPEQQPLTASSSHQR